MLAYVVCSLVVVVLLAPTDWFAGTAKTDQESADRTTSPTVVRMRQSENRYRAGQAGRLLRRTTPDKGVLICCTRFCGALLSLGWYNPCYLSFSHCPPAGLLYSSCRLINRDVMIMPRAHFLSALQSVSVCVFVCLTRGNPVITDPGSC